MKQRLRRFFSDVGGQSVVEFAVALPFLVLMSVGTFAVGMILDRHLTLGQVVRNGGNMYARGIDFSINQNKQFIMDSGTGLDLQLTGGKSAVWFTLLTRVPSDALCPNGSGGSR
ncbi:MAG: pilus assembly protein, partial [Acidobacteria bacterium]|nr:pilus assembly protein [Acidobacteriota bacterium]